jgi:chaperonin cofactor prefoldin
MADLDYTDILKTEQELSRFESKKAELEKVMKEWESAIEELDEIQE